MKYPPPEVAAVMTTERRSPRRYREANRNVHGNLRPILLDCWRCVERSDQIHTHMDSINKKQESCFTLFFLPQLLPDIVSKAHDAVSSGTWGDSQCVTSKALRLAICAVTIFGMHVIR